MENSQAIEILKSELTALRNKGRKLVSIKDLMAALAILESSPQLTAQQLERDHQRILAHYSAERQSDLEMFKSVLESGKTAINALLIINGGAVISLLGALSNLAGKAETSSFARYLALPLAQFGTGVLVAAVCLGLRYFSQASFAESSSFGDRYWKIGQGLTYAAIVVGMAGFVLFGFGLSNSYLAVKWAFAR